MSIRVLQLKARNKHKHRTHNARSTYSLNNINSGKLRAPCSSGLQKTAIPQVSHSVRMDRARRGLGVIGGRVLNSSKKLTHKNMINGEEISSNKYIEQLKLRTIAQSDKKNTATSGPCSGNKDINNNDASCTDCPDGSRRRHVSNIVKDTHVLTSSEYMKKYIPKRVENIICYDSSKDKLYGADGCTHGGC